MRAAAALHAQEPGKAEDEEDERTGRHGRGEVQIAIQSSKFMNAHRELQVLFLRFTPAIHNKISEPSSTISTSLFLDF